MTDTRPRFLLLEDSPLDAELVSAELRRGGLQCDIVVADGEASFRDALQGRIDLILSDHNLTAFDSRRALAMARERHPDVPFIVVSGTMGEDAAIDAIRGGATDYVLKSRLSRLVPCVNRALDEAAQRAALRASEERQAQLEEQVRQAQRMEAIGTLAGGIAHDFNNALTTILGFTELISADLPDDDRRREDLAAIRKAAEYSAALTRQLLAFSRRQVLAPVQLDLGLVISDLERMLRRVIGENIQLDVVTPSGVSEVLADRGQLEQVLMNLVVNARDAMPDGGKLTVSIEDSTVRYTTPMVEAGRYVLLTVRDSGVGMPREVAERVFEPFFTTKAQGHGTGLGLSTVYGIVKQSGGHISVESVVGKGTTFRVFWPVLPAGAAGDRARRPTEPEAGTRRDSAERHETILLVEDEDAVRDLVRQILVKRGYRVIAAASAEEARATMAHDAPAIDLLLTDAVLRGESGPDLSVALRAARPGLKVLFMSGYVEQTPLRRTQMENAGFLQKPFTPSALVDKVREALDS